jgi:hypothetical protein
MTNGMIGDSYIREEDLALLFGELWRVTRSGWLASPPNPFFRTV